MSEDFAANVTNAPTITIGSTSRTIGRIFMNDADSDEMGIRINPPNLVYTTNDASLWFGAGILDKSVNDFFPQSQAYAHDARALGSVMPHPYFANNGVIYQIHRRVIPEPAEYALVFGLFALGFAFFRHFRKETRNENI